MRENPDNSVYIDFEDERLEGFSLDDFETLREAFYELFPALIREKVYFLFDEIQEIEGWEKFCRRMVEKTPVQIFTAGSSSKIYPENIGKTLRGRALPFILAPLFFSFFYFFFNRSRLGVTCTGP
jgi:predicted AAA+ superfamily ATPase